MTNTHVCWKTLSSTFFNWCVENNPGDQVLSFDWKRVLIPLVCMSQHSWAELQTAPDVLVSSLHGSHLYEWMYEFSVFHRIRLQLWWWLSSWGAVEHGHSKPPPTKWANFQFSAELTWMGIKCNLAALLDSPNVIGLSRSNSDSTSFTMLAFGKKGITWRCNHAAWPRQIHFQAWSSL